MYYARRENVLYVKNIRKYHSKKAYNPKSTKLIET